MEREGGQGVERGRIGKEGAEKVIVRVCACVCVCVRAGFKAGLLPTASYICLPPPSLFISLFSFQSFFFFVCVCVCACVFRIPESG